jgi:hypothetical protein
MLRSVIGHPGLVRLLARLIARRHLPHALVLDGPPRCGRRTAARALAAALLCPEKIDGDACGRCAHCAQARSNTHPDLFELPNDREAPGGIPVDDLRAVAESAFSSPLLGVGKVIILPDAERLRGASANALLKVLEEPSPSTSLILTAASAAGLLGTIRSRVQVFRMSALSPDDAARLRSSAPQPATPPAPLAELERLVGAPDLGAVSQVQAALDVQAAAVADEEGADLTPAAAQRAVLRAWLGELCVRLRGGLRNRDPAVAGSAVDRLERVQRALGDLDRNQGTRFVLEALSIARSRG